MIRGILNDCRADETGEVNECAGGMTPNKSLQRPYDPPPVFAITRTVVASNAAELKR